MIAYTNRIFIYFFSGLLLAATAAFVYWENVYFLLVPFGLLTGFLLVQHPDYLLYALMFSIPWSIQLNVNSEWAMNFPDEPLMLLSTAAALILIIVYRTRNRQRVLFHPLAFLLGTQLVWTLCTVVTSTDPLLSTKYLLAKCWFLGAFVVLPVYLFRDKKVLRRSGVVLLFSMLAFMFFALVRHAQYNWTFAKINDALIPFFVNHVDYSALLVFMVPLLITIIRIKKDRHLKWLLWSTLIIIIGAIYFSYARGAWVALLAGMIAYWLIRRKMLFSGFVAFIILSVATVIWLGSNDRYLKFANDYNSTIFHTNFREHLVATYQLKDVSTAERFHRWVAGVRMIENSWKTGLGPNTFYHQYKAYTVPAFRTWVSRNDEHSTVHNYFLLMIIEQGLPALLLFVVLIGCLFWYAQHIYHRTGERFWKIVMAAVGAILVMECTVNFLSDMVETDKVGSVFYSCIAVIITADLQTRKKTSDPSPDI